LDTQFALVGLSDTANLVGFYENNGWQARVAYNWRDKFLDTTNAYNNEPGYTGEYATVDANISYNFNDNIIISLEGLNLTGEDKRRHGRTEAQLWRIELYEPRYMLGARYNF
jgi:outer membrane receptor protein involved in Fe transport